jgi:glucose/arabinose dehydrogenase
MPRRRSKRKNRGTLRLALAAPLASIVVACGAAGEDARSVDGLEVGMLAEGLDTPWEDAFVLDGRVLVTERPGQIRMLEDDEFREEPYAELPAEETGEGGQLGLVLDPDFDENGRMYAYYTAAGTPR